MRIALVALVLMAGVGPGWGASASLPIYDVDKGCSLLRSAPIIKDCVEREQFLYDGLRSYLINVNGDRYSWNDTTIPIREKCAAYIAQMIAINEGFKQRPYNYLNVCLLREKSLFDASHSNTSIPKFKP